MAVAETTETTAAPKTTVAPKPQTTTVKPAAKTTTMASETTVSTTMSTKAQPQNMPTQAPTKLKDSAQKKDSILIVIVGVCILAFGLIVCAGCRFKNRNGQSGNPYAKMGNDWA